MKLNRSELKKIIYDFNSISNRLLKADYQDFDGVLNKFLAYINDTKVISSYVEDCGAPTFDVAKDYEQISQSYGEYIFELGETSKAEVANVLGILKQATEHKVPIVYALGHSYSNAKKYNDILSDINERLTLVLIRHIEGYLTKIGIDMGIDETVKYNITVTNGQVNVANDNATINATLNNGIDQSELLKLITAIRETIADSQSPDEVSAIEGSLEIIESEMKQDKPRKSFVQAAVTSLKAVKSSVEFSAAVAALVQFVSDVI